MRVLWALERAALAETGRIDPSVTLLPFSTRMSGVIYLVAAAGLGGVFLFYAIRICLAYSDALAKKTFRYSILYLSLLFAALLVDHYLRF